MPAIGVTSRMAARTARRLLFHDLASEPSTAVNGTFWTIISRTRVLSFEKIRRRRFGKRNDACCWF